MKQKHHKLRKKMFKGFEMTNESIHQEYTPTLGKTGKTLSSAVVYTFLFSSTNQSTLTQMMI